MNFPDVVRHFSEKPVRRLLTKNWCLLFWLTLGLLPIAVSPGHSSNLISSVIRERRENRKAVNFNEVPHPIAESRDSLQISPYWEPEIQLSAVEIRELSKIYGMHPDFIAAVMRFNLSGDSRSSDHPIANDFISNPSIADSVHPVNDGLNRPINYHWDMVILSYTIQKSGGDIFTALAAYNSGWTHLNSVDAREYAGRVLDSFANALAVRQGALPQLTDQWALVISLSGGNIPGEPIYLHPLQTSNKQQDQAIEHSIYVSVDGNGRGFFVRGHVLPVGHSGMLNETSTVAGADQLEAPLRARLGEKNARKGMDNPRLLLVCLQTIDRLRGHTTSRWYAPSLCPPSDRD
jgi:hypothetical protein